LAHVGALKALEAAGTPPGAIAGTSCGAIIAALYALGTPGVALEHFIREQNTAEIWAQALDFGLHKASLIHGERLARWLDRKVFFGATFADAEIPLAIACTDLASGRLVVLREGSIARAVRASCALPGIFTPVAWGDRTLVDGGFYEPVPFRALSALEPSAVIGVHAGIDADASLLVCLTRFFHRSPLGRAWQRLTSRLPLRWPPGQLLRGMALAVRSYDELPDRPPGALLVRVNPPLSWWDFQKSPQAIAAGEATMRAALAGKEFPRRRQEYLD